MVSVTSFASKDSGQFSRSIYAFIPKEAVIPVLQDDTKQSEVEILVKAGDTVSEGQVIARTSESVVHASIPGVVQKIADCEYPNGMQGKACVIALHGAFETTGKKLPKQDWKKQTPEAVCKNLFECGVMNTFNGCVSLSAQIAQKKTDAARLLVVRLFDADPSCAIERYLVEHEAEKIKEGIAVIAQALEASGIVLVLSKKDEKGAAPFSLESFSEKPVTAVFVDTTKFPVGTERDIALTVRRQKKEAPWAQICSHDVYIDGETAICACEAVVYGKPCIERYVHVTGSCLNSAAVFRVKIGTKLASLAVQCGGFKKQPACIIVNGLFSGNAVDSLAIPVTKLVSCVQFQSKAHVKLCDDESCIRCGACHQVCPVDLFPERLYRAFVHGDFAATREKAAVVTARLCTECGLCNAVCPARLPLSQVMPLLREQINESD